MQEIYFTESLRRMTFCTHMYVYNYNKFVINHMINDKQANL